MKLCVAVGILALAASGNAFADDLNLICAGTATGTASQQSHAFVTDPNTGQSAYGNAVTTQREEYDGRVRVHFDDTGGRILIPRRMWPPIHGQAEDGWWPLDHVQMSEDAIHARFGLNIFNHPSVAIDRRSGSIEIGGLGGGFSGDCEVDQTATGPRRF